MLFFPLTPWPKHTTREAKPHLAGIPTELLNQILKELALAQLDKFQSVSSTISYKENGTAVIAPQALVKTLGQMRLNRKMAQDTLEFFVTRVKAQQKMEDQGTSLFTDERTRPGSVWNTFDLYATKKSLQQLDAIGRNHTIVPLIRNISYHAFDYTQKRSVWSTFVEELEERWFVTGDQGRGHRRLQYDKAPWDDDQYLKDHIASQEYCQYLCMLTEHQILLKHGEFSRDLPALFLVSSTQRISRSPARQHGAIPTETGTTSESLSHTRSDLLISPVKREAAAEHNKITKLDMINIVPDLSMAHPNDRRPAQPFFAHLKNINISCAYDDKYTDVTRCRNELKDGGKAEARAWPDFLSKRKGLESLAIRPECEDAPKELPFHIGHWLAPKIHLINLLLGTLRVAQVSKLALETSRVSSDAFHRFMKTHPSLEYVYINEIILHNGEVMRECRELPASTLLACIKRLPNLKVAAIHKHDDPYEDGVRVIGPGRFACVAGTSWDFGTSKKVIPRIYSNYNG